MKGKHRMVPHSIRSMAGIHYFPCFVGDKLTYKMNSTDVNNNRKTKLLRIGAVNYEAVTVD